MKKILLTSIALAGLGVSAFGQGQILFENDLNSTSFVTLNTGGTSASGLVVELLWNNGSGFVVENTFTSTYTGLGQNGQAAGQFTGPELTIPTSGTQTFEVEGFYTTGGHAYTGITVAFTAPVTVSPAPLGKTDNGGSWTGSAGGQGDMELFEIVPEPSTIALGGLGAAALLLFRRRK
jgi:hypothetical protein